MKTAVSAARGAASIANIHQDANRKVQTGELSKQDAKAFVDSKQGQILEHLWKLNVADIESTLTKVVDKVSITIFQANVNQWMNEKRIN